ncbi:pyrokinin-1 receptor-like [Lycorma delicatula]|uniref:pyrokinin-1 receptor-like n=1 Tax=Lycorma delicatula TaxID=130591 RepID=UPI003F51120A
MEELQNWTETKGELVNYTQRWVNTTNEKLANPLYIVLPMTILYVLILVCGVIGNVSTCVVIARNKHMHTATNYYLFSLAVSDLLLLLSGLPQELFYLLFNYPYIFGETVCVLTGLASETSANATVLTITAFTVERYVAICHPFLSHTVSKLSRAIKFVVVIWLLAFCLAVPQAIQFGLVELETNGTEGEWISTQCTLKKEVWLEHAFEISTCVFFVAPMTLITVLYVLIGLKLRRSRLLKRPSFSNVAERQNQKNQNHVIRMLVAVVVAFFICWAPFHAQRLLAVYASSRTEHSESMVAVYSVLTYISGILYYLSTTINPVLYNIMSHKFRDAFKGTLSDLCGWSEKKSLVGRKYSVLSRGVLLNHSRVRHQSVSWSNQEMIIQSHQPIKQINNLQLPKVNNNQTIPKKQSPVGAVTKRLKLFKENSTNVTSIDSANTISNSSLQDLDEPEFTGSELADYMGELNNR